MHLLWHFGICLSQVSEVKVDVVIVLVFMAVLSAVVGFSIYAYRVYYQKIINNTKDQYELKLSHSRELQKESIRAQEAERERIASQLHDDVGNKLNILSLWCANPELLLNNVKSGKIMPLLSKLIDTTRSISHTLYPANLERFGLDTTLDELIKDIAPSISCEYWVIPEYRKMSLDIELQLFRVVQEFMSNSIKHAQAKSINIDMRMQDKYTFVVISDDGIGFDLEESKRGMGIRNMESRLRNLQATFKWKSVPTKGTKLIAYIPL